MFSHLCLFYFMFLLHICLQFVDNGRKMTIQYYSTVQYHRKSTVQYCIILDNMLLLLLIHTSCRGESNYLCLIIKTKVFWVVKGSIQIKKNKPKGLKVAKEDHMADRHDGQWVQWLMGMMTDGFNG